MPRPNGHRHMADGTPHFDHPVRTLQDLTRGSPSMLRRDLLTRSGLALAAGAMGSSAGLLDAAAQDNPREGADGLDWPAVRAQFALSHEFIHMTPCSSPRTPGPFGERSRSTGAEWTPIR